MTADNAAKLPPNVEIAIDTKAQKAAEKMLQSQRNLEIYNNFATPLSGTFLNLPAQSALIQCPSCGVLDMSEVHEEPKKMAEKCNSFLGCLFVSLCCCCCFNYSDPCGQRDTNHYCQNCHCYFGRSKRVPPIVIR
uniref:LITAF domain-containing protein n=1 Tax=Stomoxys calcitrans TaxID=35570 RepID=A0A1I8NN64_STOCA